MKAPAAAALSLAMFVEAVGYGMVAPTLPFLAKGMGAGETGVGLLVGLYAAAGLLASLPLASLGDRLGRRPLILAGLAAVSLASIGFVSAPSYAWLVAIRFAQGLGATAIWVGSLTLAGDLAGETSMARSLAWITGSWSLGFVLGPALGGVGGSVTTPFLIYAGLSALGWIAAWWVLPESRVRHEPIRLRDLREILGRRPVWSSAAVTFSLAFFFAALDAFLPLLAAEAGLSRGRIGLLFAIAGIPAIALPRLVGGIADRFGDRRALHAGLGYAVLFCFCFPWLFRALPDWLLFLMIGLVDVLIYVPAVAMLHRGLPNRERAFATASHSYAFSAGFFSGPLVGGVAMGVASYEALFPTLAAVLVACAALLRKPRAPSAIPA